MRLLGACAIYIIDAPSAEPQGVSEPQTAVDEQAPAQQNRTVTIHDGNNNQDDVQEDDLRRDAIPPDRLLKR